MTAMRYFVIFAAFLGVIGFFGAQIKGFETLRAEGRLSNLNKDELPPKGVLVFKEENGVSKFARIDAGALAPNEFKLAYIKQRRELDFGGPRFYFENGTAQDYEAARYGVFKVNENGKAVLVNLADKERAIINPKP